MRKVWGPEYREGYEGLRVYIRRLRQKIEEDPRNPTYVVTRPGVGYMLTYPD
ncbi:MAG: winged helix-turn-helix domain-containing protein [Candidatus Bathyanammoxibius sp.]